MPGIPNRGSAGAVLDATSHGLIRVEGPAIWGLLDRSSGETMLYSSAFPKSPGYRALHGADTWELTLWQSIWSTSTVTTTNPIFSFGSNQVAVQRERFGNLTLNTSGMVTMNVQSTGDWASGVFSAASSVSVPTDTIGLRISFEYSGGTSYITFYTTNDGTTWTQLGVQRSIAGDYRYAHPTDVEAKHLWIGGWGYGGGNGDKQSFAWSGATWETSNGMVLNITPEDIADLAPTATQFQCSSGQPITIIRPVDGPVTTLVPEGTVVYVNPDDTDAGNLITIPQSETFDIADGESFVMAWTGNVPPDIPLYEQYFGIGNDTAGNPGYGIRAHAAIEGIYAFARSDLEVSRASNVLSLASNRPAVHAIRIDRSTNPTPHVEHFYYNPNRNRSINQTIAAGWTATTTVGPTLLKRLASTASSWLFKKGVVTDDELDAIARRLLVNASRPARNTTGPVPPASPVYGDRWRAENGDTAKFNGAEWEPISPSTGVNMAELLGNAVLLLDAKGSVPGEQYARNRGKGGHVLDARYGSSTAVDTNDPLFLPHTGENYVYQAGTAMSAPDSDDFNYSSLLEARWVGVRNAWALGSGNADIVAHDNGGGTRGWYWRIGGGSSMTFAANGNLTGGFYTAPTTMPVALGGVADGETIAMKATLAMNAGVGTVHLYAKRAPGSVSLAVQQMLSDDDWTLVGTGNLNNTIGTPNNSTSPMYIGAPGNAFTGSVYGAQVKCDGVERLMFNAATDITDAGATSFTASSGQTVTVTRATSGRKTALVTRPIWLFGTDDHMLIPDSDLLDFGAGQEFSIVAVRRIYDPLWTALFSKRASSAAADAGWTVQKSAGSGVPRARIQVGDGVTNVFADAPEEVVGALNANVSTRDAAGLVKSRINTDPATVFTGTMAGDLSNSLPTYVGRLGGGTANYSDFELVAVGVWRRELTTDEIAALNTYYGTV